MALACTAFEAPYAVEYKSSQPRKVNVIDVTGDNVTAKTVLDADPGRQLWVIGGYISVSDTTDVYLKSAANGTVIGHLAFVAAGTDPAPLCYTNAGELLEIKLSANVTIQGRLYVVSVGDGDSLPVLTW